MGIPAVEYRCGERSPDLGRDDACNFSNKAAAARGTIPAATLEKIVFAKCVIDQNSSQPTCRSSIRLFFWPGSSHGIRFACS